MSYAGYDLSPSSNQFVPPTYTELEATAAVKNMQVNLAIMKDTLEVPFSEMHKQDIWKYQSNSSRPTLPLAHTLRTANPETQAEPNTAWQSRYDQLIKELPEDIQSALAMNKELAREQQFTSLVALEYALTTLAKALVIVESGGEPLMRESAAESRRRINEQVPDYARDNYQRSAYEVLSAVQVKINEVGRNHPNYDDLTYYTSLSEEGLRALQGEA